MYAILKYKNIGFHLKAKENELIFEDNSGSYISYRLEEKKVYTNIVYSSRDRLLNNYQKQMMKELGWLDE